jgi:arylsulfatase A-like enzyme
MQILDSLQRTDQVENTIVIFTSDNGSPQYDGDKMEGKIGSIKKFDHDPSRPWRGLKGDIWEGGHRVPLIVRWPGKIAAGTTSDHPVILTDWMRTFANLVQYELPNNAAEDSFDLQTALLGQPTKLPQRDHLIHHSSKGMYAIRHASWKLILGAGSGGLTRDNPMPDEPAEQLYDLANDPGEQNNQFEKQPDKVDNLRQMLQQYQQGGRSTPL